jgi:polysaccharide biosynthesis transport protein
MDATKTQAPQDAKLHFLDYWRIIRIRKTIILAVFLLVVITATLVTFILPESFSSTAKIRIERDQTDIQGMQGPSYANSYDPFFIQTEFELIRSEEILGKVITKLNLNQKWAPKYLGQQGGMLKTQETLRFLRANVSLNTVRNTSLIEITVYSDKPEEAAQLANEVADTYKEYREKKRANLTEGGIVALKKAWAEQNELIQQAQTNVDYLREKLQIPESVVNADVPSTLFTSESLRRVEDMRLQGRTELGREETLLAKLSTYSPADLVQALPTAVSDTHLSSLLEQKTMVEQKLVAAQKQLGNENVDLKALEAQRDSLNAEIGDRAKGILLGLQAKVDSARAAVSDLEQEVDKATSNDIAKATQSRPYFDAKRKLEELNGFGKLLLYKIASETTDKSIPKTNVEIPERAVPGIKPVRPNKPFNIALGIIIGLVVGVGLAFFIEYLDTSVKTIDDVERSLGAPVLGVIPQNVGLLLDEGGDSPHAEAYRVLRTNLLFSRKDDKLNSVAVVSAGAGEGKSTTVFNLAAVFAQGGQRVLIVDSDLRRPTLHKMLRVTNNIGLTNYLLKQNTLEEVIQTTSLPTLDFMASGKLPSSSLGILSSAQMKEVISNLKQHYDFVFFDSPPVMGVSDASILASEVDMTIQVIQYRRYPQPMNIRAKQLIEKVGGNLAGIVLNNINMSQDESYYYYSGYYHDYYSKDEEQEAAPEAGPGSKAT